MVEWLRVNVRQTKFTVFPSRIQSLFNPGGETYRWTQGLAAGALAKAVELAPMGMTGELKRSHRVRTTPHYMGDSFTLSNVSDHAYYVHEGTIGKRIVASGPGRAMYNPHTKFGRLWVKYPQPVRGQFANQWMTKAVYYTIRQHGVV